MIEFEMKKPDGLWEDCCMHVSSNQVFCSKNSKCFYETELEFVLEWSKWLTEVNNTVKSYLKIWKSQKFTELNHAKMKQYDTSTKYT